MKNNKNGNILQDHGGQHQQVIFNPPFQNDYKKANVCNIKDHVQRTLQICRVNTIHQEKEHLCLIVHDAEFTTITKEAKTEPVAPTSSSTLVLKGYSIYNTVNALCT